MNILVTGGYGFIGSEFIRQRMVHHPKDHIVNLDALTYAANRANLPLKDRSLGYRFIHGDVADAAIVDMAMAGAHVVVHFAAETHVDRSIAGSAPFIRTNLIGTHTLLEAARRHHAGLFVMVSTDEVYGSLGPDDYSSRETDPTRPRSPYSASKAGAEALALSYHHTHGLPVVVTRASNNYGPYQHPEKALPLMITRWLSGKPFPLYGDGGNVRDWLHVSDHVAALNRIIACGVDVAAGEIYNIGGGSEITNTELVRLVAYAFRAMNLTDGPVERVRDRAGHDRRYSLDCTKINRLGWQPMTGLVTGLEQTVRWYVENREWWAPLVGEGAR